MSNPKGSAIMRIAAYFRKTEFDEARMAFKLVSEIMDERFKESVSTAKSQARAIESRPKRQGQRPPKPPVITNSNESANANLFETDAEQV
jgi:hypothetical protein